MANIPLKWGIIGTDGKVEINGADDSAFSSSSPAFKVNGDGTVTGSFSVSDNGTITGNLTVSGANGISAVKITTTGDVTVGGSLSVTGNENLTGNLIMPPAATISVKGTKNTGKVISFIDNTVDGNGLGISIGGGGPTIIGGGEAADTLKAQVGTSGAEEMYIGNDGNVSIFSNLQTGWAARKAWTFGTNGTFTAQPGSGVTYIAGCGGSQSGIYVKKGSLNTNQWIPAVTVQTNGGGGWAMGNYNNESLEFAYGTKANIDASNNEVSHFYLTADGTNQQRWICSTSNGAPNNVIVVGDGSTSGVKSSGYGITTAIASGSTTSLITSAAVATGTLLRNTMVPSSTSWSVDNLKGQTRFVYTAHGTPHSGTTVAFDSSNTENYTLQLNSNYAGAAANARLSFRTRNGDAGTWSNWLYACPVYRFNTRLEANTNKTLYVPLEMRNGTAGDCFFLVASNNYGNSGLYFLTPNTAVAHQMLITSIKAASYLTVAATTDDWGFKVTAGQAAFYLTLIRLS